MCSVTDWLDQLGLGQYQSVFAANDVDMEVLPELTEADLEKLGVSLGRVWAWSATWPLRANTARKVSRATRLVPFTIGSAKVSTCPTYVRRKHRSIRWNGPGRDLNRPRHSSRLAVFGAARVVAVAHRWQCGRTPRLYR